MKYNNLVCAQNIAIYNSLHNRIGTSDESTFVLIQMYASVLLCVIMVIMKCTDTLLSLKRRHSVSMANLARNKFESVILCTWYCSHSYKASIQIIQKPALVTSYFSSITWKVSSIVLVIGFICLTLTFKTLKYLIQTTEWFFSIWNHHIF